LTTVKRADPVLHTMEPHFGTLNVVALPLARFSKETRAFLWTNPAHRGAQIRFIAIRCPCFDTKRHLRQSNELSDNACLKAACYAYDGLT